MLLTNSEYQSFKNNFHCTALPDEEYCVPIYVKTPDGGATWTVYVAGAKFHPGVDWITRLRREAVALLKNETLPEPSAEPKNAGANDFVLPMD